MLKRYPWESVKHGQGFFVPALDLKTESEAGLKAAVRQRVFDARAAFIIKQGRLGVWFYRGWISPKWQSGSSIV